MPSRAQRRKQSAKNRKQPTKAANKALFASAQRFQERLEDISPASSIASCSPFVAEVTKLMELFPNMSASICEQVYAKSNTIEDAGEKLALMTNPCDICDEGATDVGEESVVKKGFAKVVIPDVDDAAEYPNLCSTVESAFEVVGSQRNTKDNLHEDDDDVKKHDFVIVTDADATDWCVIDTKELGIMPEAPKASYAQTVCST